MSATLKNLLVESTDGVLSILICIGEGLGCRGSVVINPTVRVHADLAGYPLHRENRENGQKIPCQGKHREFGNFAKIP